MQQDRQTDPGPARSWDAPTAEVAAMASYVSHALTARDMVGAGHPLGQAAAWLAYVSAGVSLEEARHAILSDGRDDDPFAAYTLARLGQEMIQDGFGPADTWAWLEQVIPGVVAAARPSLSLVPNPGRRRHAS
jgi:hypothetical protein